MPRAAILATAGACGGGLLTVLVRLAAPTLMGLNMVQSLAPATRYLLLEVWTARVWPLSATLIALLVSALYGLSRRGLPPLVQRHVDASVGAGGEEGPFSPWQLVLLAGMHLAGLALLWHLAARPLWWAAPSLLGLLALATLARPRRLRFETLAPMFPAYLSAAATLLLTRWLQVDVEAYQAFPLPDPWSPWFNVPVMVAAGVAFALLIQVRMIADAPRGSPSADAPREPSSVDVPSRSSSLDAPRGSPDPRSDAGSGDPAGAKRGDDPARARWQRALPLVLALLVALWLLATVVRHRTHGVTASDPYAYVQMAIDLAERGTALHAFPLAGLAREWGLPTWPAVHVGYHPPGPDHHAPTMWSIGWPLLMAPLYRLGGLEALYWAAPLVGALALVATWGLANEALRAPTQARRGLARGMRWTVAALTCALVATSPEGSERLLVPMADAAAQLFTVLVLWLLLRGLRGRAVPYGALAGACFGVAYFVRHPQLPLGLAAVVAALALRPRAFTSDGSSELARGEATLSKLGTRSPSTRVQGSPDGHRAGYPSLHRAAPKLLLLLAFGLVALIVALPDLAYHKAAFGGWLASESSEWFLISARNVCRSFFDVLLNGLLRREEIGYLTPLALLGGWLLTRRHRRAAGVLFAGLGGVFVFHLFYEALRPRDLIAILPVLYLCAGYGFVVAWQEARARRTLLVALFLLCCMVMLFARSTRTLALPVREDVITFGHVRADQLAAFQALHALTPEDAVVGSMLNSGAIELHAGREAVHPAPWSEEELARWVEGLLAEGRAFYVLDDGEEMPAVIERLEERYRVRHVATLGLPYFALGGGNLPHPAQLYEVEKP
jgi:hypothetical protein